MRVSKCCILAFELSYTQVQRPEPKCGKTINNRPFWFCPHNQIDASLINQCHKVMAFRMRTCQPPAANAVTRLANADLRGDYTIARLAKLDSSTQELKSTANFHLVYTEEGTKRLRMLWLRNMHCSCRGETYLLHSLIPRQFLLYGYSVGIFSECERVGLKILHPSNASEQLGYFVRKFHECSSCRGDLRFSQWVRYRTRWRKLANMLPNTIFLKGAISNCVYILSSSLYLTTGLYHFSY